MEPGGLTRRAAAGRLGRDMSAPEPRYDRGESLRRRDPSAPPPPTGTMALARRIAARCAEAGLRVGVAESCTAGLVAAALASVPGASAWFRGGVVSYATDVKRDLLGVGAALLAGPGPVSAPVAEAMAAGARRALGADLAVSVTGLAGPGGDPERDLPVGTVYVGWSGPRGAGAEGMRFPGGREAVRAAARDAALAALLRCAEP